MVETVVFIEYAFVCTHTHTTNYSNPETLNPKLETRNPAVFVSRISNVMSLVKWCSIRSLADLVFFFTKNLVFLYDICYFYDICNKI